MPGSRGRFEPRGDAEAPRCQAFRKRGPDRTPRNPPGNPPGLVMRTSLGAERPQYVRPKMLSDL